MRLQKRTTLIISNKIEGATFSNNLLMTCQLAIQYDCMNKNADTLANPSGQCKRINYN